MSWSVLVNESHCLLFYERNSDIIIFRLSTRKIINSAHTPLNLDNFHNFLLSTASKRLFLTSSIKKHHKKDTKPNKSIKIRQKIYAIKNKQN